MCSFITRGEGKGELCFLYLARNENVYVKSLGHARESVGESDNRLQRVMVLSFKAKQAGLPSGFCE